MNKKEEKALNTIREVLNLKSIYESFPELKEECILSIDSSIFQFTISAMMKSLLYEYEKTKNNNSQAWNEFTEILMDREALTCFFKKYIVLEKIIKTKYNDTVKFVKEIFANLNADRSQLQIFLGRSIGELISIEISMGDTHNNGKSVAIITDQEGGFIYKPHSLANDIMLNNIMSFASKGVKLDVKTVPTLDCQNHGWQQKIQYKECTSMSEVKNYYYRAGCYLATFYILGSFDIHYENVIASGEYPYIIDCETLIQCHGINLERLEPRSLELSVLTSHFIPYETDSIVVDVDISGLFCRQIQSQKNFEIVPIFADGEVSFEKKFHEIKKSNNRLFINGKIATAEVALRPLTNGFRDTLFYYTNHKEKLLEIIDHNKSNYFRLLLRPTKVYMKFILAAQSPEVLMSYEKYNDMFDILRDNFTPGKNGYIRVENEIEQLKSGNVPLYYTKYNDKHLYVDNDRVLLENQLNITAKDFVHWKIEVLNKDIIYYQEHLIALSLYTIYKNYFNKKSTCMLPNEKMMSEDKENIIRDGVKFFMDNTISINDKASTMLNAQFVHGKSKIQYINADMYEGGGVIWFLACYGSQYQDSQVTELAKKLFQFVYNYYCEKRNEVYLLSPFTGHNALVYLAYNINMLNTEDTIFSRAYDQLIDSCTKYVHSYEYSCLNNDKSEITDYLYGIPSAIQLFVNLYKETADERIRKILLQLTEKLENYLSDNEAPFVIGIAHGLSGIIIALAQSYSVFKNASTVSYIDVLLQMENNLINIEEETKYSWCRGLTGILLARHILLCSLPKNHYLRQRIVEQVIKLLDEKYLKHYVTLSNMSYCHGIYGNIDILRTVLKEADYLDKDTRKTVGTYINLKFAESFDSLNVNTTNSYPLEGFFLGISGILYCILADGTSLPSILKLDVIHK